MESQRDRIIRFYPDLSSLREHILNIRSKNVKIRYVVSLLNLHCLFSSIGPYMQRKHENVLAITHL